MTEAAASAVGRRKNFTDALISPSQRLASGQLKMRKNVPLEARPGAHLEEPEGAPLEEPDVIPLEELEGAPLEGPEALGGHQVSPVTLHVAA